MIKCDLNYLGLEKEQVKMTIIQTGLLMVSTVLSMQLMVVQASYHKSLSMRNPT